MPPNNAMSVWGNPKTMNLNTLVLTNIQSSPYFKVNLFELKTYHEVIDEIYYKVGHLEPWEKGSRKTAGQTGMCGGVRGVGAGGIVSSAYCLLYKLFTLKLTKKQVIGLINHRDSPYIRGLGFMYIRYTQPPPDLWPWFEDYLDDEEEIDVKAGGGHIMTIGEMLRQWLVKLEWYATLFPRIPVPIEKDLAAKLKTRPVLFKQPEPEPEEASDNQGSFGEAARRGGYQDNGRDDSYRKDRGGDDNYRNYRGDSSRGDNYRGDNYHGDSSRGDNYRGDSSRGDSYRGDSYRGRDDRRDEGRWKDGRTDGGRGGDSRNGSSRDHRASPSHQRSSASHRSDHNTNSFERDLARERERQQREHGREGRRSRSRSPRDKHVRSRTRSRSRDRKDKNSRSRSRDRKEKKSHKRDGNRDHESSSGHKRSHKEKKDKHRDREEKPHKHKSRDKERH